MHIGLLTTSFPRFERDLAGTFVLGFARALTVRGHTVDVLAPEPCDPVALPSWPGIQVRWVPYLRPRRLQRTFYGAGAPDNLSGDPRAWLGVGSFPLALLRAAGDQAPAWDALVSHWALPSALVAGAVRGKRPHLAVLHSADVHVLRRLPGRSTLARRISRQATSLLCTSSALRDAFLDCLPPVARAEAMSRCHVSPMGIDPTPRPVGDRRTLRRQLGLGRFTALAMARLVALKGLDDAVRAVAASPETELCIAGEGPERERLARLAHELGAPVRLLGTVTGDAKHHWLRAADAFVMPSRPNAGGRTEGTPTAVLEAMAAGLPVVASETGGLATLLAHGRNGLLVPPSNPEALADALERLRLDHALRRRLGRAGRTVGSRYGWNLIGPRIEELITSP